MNEPVPARIPLGDGSADEVRLRGTLNLPLTSVHQRAIIAEAARVLKPGGRLFVHVLVGESPVENPDLPGPAGAVRSVPFESDPATLLEEAGFVGIKMLKFGASPCFVRGGVAMRELQLEGFIAIIPAEGETEVLYKGPFSEVRDESGRVYPRGRRVVVPASVAERLRSSSQEFVVFQQSPTRHSLVEACSTR
jgi:SAM-dependent methyltransferase